MFVKLFTYFYLNKNLNLPHFLLERHLPEIFIMCFQAFAEISKNIKIKNYGGETKFEDWKIPFHANEEVCGFATKGTDSRFKSCKCKIIKIYQDFWIF